MSGTQEEAAEAYDIAAIKFRGVNAVTNFDISRYDVDRIMASNTLLAGELARRNKQIEPGNEAAAAPEPLGFDSSTTQNNNAGINPDEASNGANGNGSTDWKMALYQNQQQQQAATCVAESLDHHKSSMTAASGSYRNASFSMALQDLIGIESMNSNNNNSHGIDDDVGCKQVTHFSNSSSLVTSLSSSREGSPDKTNVSMPFAKPPPLMASKLIGAATSGVGSWYPSPPQLRPTAISMAHLPVFAAWNDT